VILLMGGSYESPRLYNQVNALLDGLAAEAKEKHGITVRHGFASDQEEYPYVSPTRVRR
jgi:hypothetical protein